LVANRVLDPKILRSAEEETSSLKHKLVVC